MLAFVSISDFSDCLKKGLKARYSPIIPDRIPEKGGDYVGKMSVKLEGFDKLQAKLKENVKLSDVKACVQKHGSEMQTTAHLICPRDTGTLADSITLVELDNGMTVEVEPHTNYAAYVEYGTRFMPAQPYMRPAFIQESARFKEDLKKLTK